MTHQSNFIRKKAEAATFFTSENIKDCMKKVRICGLHQEIKIDEGFYLKVYYAGHVLGAGMFRVTVGEESVLYTGRCFLQFQSTAEFIKCRPTTECHWESESNRLWEYKIVSHISNLF